MPESVKPFQYKVDVLTDAEAKRIASENPELHQQVLEGIEAQRLVFEQSLREIQIDEAD